MSDDEEGDYSSVRRNDDVKGVKLLFSKSKVYVHPTASAKDNVAGFIALLQQKSNTDARPTSSASAASQHKNDHDLLLAWIPEKSLGETRDTYTKVELLNMDSDSPPKQSSLVPMPAVATAQASSLGIHAFAVPVADVFSMVVRPPSVGWWFGSIVINTRIGESLPALFFHDSECVSTIAQRKKLQRETFSISSEDGHMFWGGDRLLEWLKQFVTIERSTHETNVYLVNPSEADKVSFGGGSKAPADKVRNLLEGKDANDPSSSRSPPREDALSNVLKQARWTFLETMSQVTTFTRRTAQAVAENRNVPPQVRRLMQNPQVKTVSDEFDSARVYLARWAMGIAEQSERERRGSVWTAQDVLSMEESEVGEFEILDVDAQGLSLADKRRPVTATEWAGFFNARTGRLERTPDEVKERVFHGGLSAEDGVRKEAWMFLLGIYDWESTKEERLAKMNSLRDEYIRLKGAWWERLVDETGTLEEREWWKEQRARIEKDVHRTDRHLVLFAGEDIPHPDPDSPFAEAGTNVHLEQMKDLLLTYNEYNRDLGYVQGMSDLLAPIYAVEQDDAVAFWGFQMFMERMERNFLRDQSGMRLQLTTLDQLIQLLDPKLYAHLAKLDCTNFFFFFRFLLIWFKREFDFEDILRLWECLWTDFLSSNYHLFIAAAILDKHRDVIMTHLHGFDEVLKYVNELSGTIDLYSTLVRAEALFRRFQRTVETVDKNQNFPAPSTLRQRLPQPPPPTTATQWISTGNDRASRATRGNRSSSSGKAPENDEQAPGISPELRVLLNRNVPKLEKHEVHAHGGGIGS